MKELGQQPGGLKTEKFWRGAQIFEHLRARPEQARGRSAARGAARRPEVLPLLGPAGFRCAPRARRCARTPALHTDSSPLS